MKTNRMAGVVLALVVAGCEDRVRGQLTVLISTNMRVPGSLTDVTLRVKQDNTIRFQRSRRLPLKDEPLPFTVALIRGEEPAPVAEVRVAAWQDQTLRIVREVITTLPESRRAYLPIELQWFCLDNVQGSGGTPSEPDLNKVSNNCPDGQTCVDGECESSTIDEDVLPDLDDQPERPDECFDVQACFQDANQVFVDDTECLIDNPRGGKGANVAIMIEDNGDGFCLSDGRCVLPLDGYSEQGWTVSGDKVKLTRGACADARVTGVLVTTTCTTKTISQATCTD
jgi:hypothetical protein